MLEETDDLIVAPGVYDGVSARAALEVGFNALYMTGAGTTASRLGQPDLGIAHLHDMRANAEMIANLSPYGPPLIADMDTGYGGPITIARTVTEYIRAGVAGAHLEDQILTKRCGHLLHKPVISASAYTTRLRAAASARAAAGSDFVLIARTDALQTLGYDEE
ncbi:putative carboxyphosphonoenolpyruvate [Diplodia seriata]|uniref:Putative carboxyphosphonoenolpyruvate n=1 Tax=Diplodia seriata TaxID=420778 RepID=A0A0G2EHE5_9PEZI|nr:putative carboxyphosphonoenolpyruvate [Diplodia seriata]